MVLRTARLELRPIEDEDVAALVRHWGDAQVRRYLWDDKPVTYDIVSDIVTTSNRDFKRAGYGIWAVRKQGEEALIGMCGLRDVQATHWTEILYSLRPRFWGQGFATEAARGVLHYAFEQLGLERVYASFDDVNLASAGVLRRLGMLPLEEPVPMGTGSSSSDEHGARHYSYLTRDRYRAWSVPPTHQTAP